jgi:Tol biopolymer transport system component
MVAALAAALVLAPGPVVDSDPAPQPSRIVFASARTTVSQLYSVPPTGEGLAQLTFGAGGWKSPVPSPDGRFVAAFHGYELWLMRPDGSGARLLAAPVTGGVSWSADSRRLVFANAGGMITTVAAAGGRPRQITRSYRDSLPVFSPDGRAIAFVRESVPAEDRRRTLVVRRNGRNRRVLAGVSSGPAWSPDGKRIAIETGNGSSLVLVRPTGGAPQVVGRLEYGCFSCFPSGPVWSPNGQRLAYGDSAGIRVVPRSGSGGQLLVRGVYAQGIAWSPSGDALTFATTAEIGLVTLDGQRRTLVPFGPDEAQPGVGWSSSPADLHYRTPEETPLLVRVRARELQARVPIRQLSADGDRVAYWLCPDILGAWRPGEAEQIPLGASTLVACHIPSSPTNLGHIAYDLALAGDRLAYLTDFAANEFHWSLRLATLELRTAGVEIAQEASPRNWPGPEPPALGDAVGGGSLLVYGSRGSWYGSPPPPEAIWRLDGTTPVQIARRAYDLQPLAVDHDRILARRADGMLELLDADGGTLRTFDLPSLGATLAGDDLVMLVRGELRDYSAASGELLHAWPLPDVPSSGRCRASYCEEIRLTLDDAARGLAVFTLDGVVHLLRLRDGFDSTLPGATAAELTDAGLFYAYAGEEPWPGRIRFVPFAELPL